MAEELEQDDDDSDLQSLDDISTKEKDTAQKSTKSSSSSSDTFSIGIGEGMDTSKFEVKQNLQKTEPLWPKMGMIIAIAAVLLAVSCAVAPMIGGTKSNAAASFNSHRLKNEGIEAIATPPIVLFGIAVVFALMSVLFGWI